MNPSGVKIERLKKENFSDAFSVIKEAIIDNCEKEGLNRTVLDYILQKQKNRLKNILENPLIGQFLVAKKDDKIIGIIGFAKIGEEIKNGLKKLKIKPDENKIVEIISAYVKPSFQSQGIGSLLFKLILEVIRQKNIEYFSLESGFERGVKFWTKKLGKATIILKKYFQSKGDCHIWIKKVNETKEDTPCFLKNICA